MNHFQTGQGPCAALHKWGIARSPSCDCGQRQTMNHIVDMCPLTKFEGGLNLLHDMTGIYSNCSTREIINNRKWQGISHTACRMVTLIILMIVLFVRHLPMTTVCMQTSRCTRSITRAQLYAKSSHRMLSLMTTSRTVRHCTLLS